MEFIQKREVVNSLKKYQNDNKMKHMETKLTVVQWLEIQLKKGIEYNVLDPLSYQKSVDALFDTLFKQPE